MKEIILIHIEKSGGSSLRDAIEKVIPREQIFNLFNPDPLPTLVEEYKQGKRYQVINGHFDYGLHLDLGIFPNYTTQLRDPVERFISHYVHWATRKENWAKKRIREKCPTVSEFLHDPSHIHISNFACKRLTTFHQGTVDYSQMSQAVMNLASFNFVTFLDDIDDINEKWSNYLGKRIFFPHSNKGLRKNYDVTPEDIERIKEINKYDILLYEAAREMFKN